MQKLADKRGGAILTGKKNNSHTATKQNQKNTHRDVP